MLKFTVIYLFEPATRSVTILPALSTTASTELFFSCSCPSPYTANPVNGQVSLCSYRWWDIYHTYTTCVWHTSNECYDNKTANVNVRTYQQFQSHCNGDSHSSETATHQTGFVGKGSDHLPLIKFWPSRAPGKGVFGGVKIFGSALLQPAHSVCVSLSAFFIHMKSNQFTSETADSKIEIQEWPRVTRNPSNGNYRQ